MQKYRLEDCCKINKAHFIPGNDMYVLKIIKQWKLFLNDINNKLGSKIAITEKE